MIFRQQPPRSPECVSTLDGVAPPKASKRCVSKEVYYNPALNGLTPYEPGRLIEDVACEISQPADAILKLASNENPLGPSPLALRAARESLAQMHLYPDSISRKLRIALAEEFRVDSSQIIIGNGSNEILELLFHAFTVPGETSAVGSQYTFAIYPLLAKLFNVTWIETPATVDFGHDLDAMARAIRPDTRLVFIANPNNPTGHWIHPDQILEFIQKVPSSTIILLDEAYDEFCAERSPSISWVQNHPNLIITRTFSKIYGLAGLRVGYGVASNQVADFLRRSMQPFAVNSIAQAAAPAALGDKEHVQKTVDLTRHGQNRLVQLCNQLKLRTLPSQGNFRMIQVGDGKRIYEKLLQQGVIVRPLGGYNLKEWIRVSIGTPKQMERFSETFEKVIHSVL